MRLKFEDRGIDIIKVDDKFYLILYLDIFSQKHLREYIHYLDILFVVFLDSLKYLTH